MIHPSRFPSNTQEKVRPLRHGGFELGGAGRVIDIQVEAFEVNVRVRMAIKILLEELGIRDSGSVEDRVLYRKQFVLGLSKVGFLAEADQR